MATSKTVVARAVFLGAPGAGKGTQAQRLAADASVPHISTGDMLRAQVAAGTELGLAAKGYMDAGQLVPDDLMIAMVKERIAEPDARAAWILDGFPRTLPQAQALDESLAQAGGDSTLTHVVSFQVPEEALVRRLSGRRTCGQCGAIWHVDFKPTEAEGVCDLCGGELTQRSDDRPEAIGKRLEVYRAQTAPLLDYYRNQSILVEVDANHPPNSVYQELVKVMQ